MKIGIFDSGIGGKTLIPAIKKVLPAAEIVYESDPQHLPFGNKSPEQIFSYVRLGAQKLTDQGCEIIVLACHTATTNAIANLRAEFEVPFVGIEPAVKPAVALSKNKKIAVLATHSTLHSSAYIDLKTQYAHGVTVFDVDCTDWVLKIEKGQLSRADLMGEIEPLLIAGVDVIVLGCTHFNYFERKITELTKQRVKVIQPAEAIAKRVASLV